MVDISPNSALFRLVDRLESTRILTDLELSYEDILDSLWLASYLEKNESNTGNKKSSEQNQQQSPIPIIDRPEAESTPEDISNQEDNNPQADLYTEESLEIEPSTSPHTEGLPFKVPAAPAIQNSLQISRAIRPLMRKVPSRTKTILDEEATVTRIAEKDVWLPVTKPKPERWLDLELIVENSRSTFIWQETINELQQVLENHGAFRNVRVWDLATPDKSQLKLARRTKSEQTNRSYSHRELIQSNGRSLILLISDCVSSIWQQGLIYPWLQQWSQKQPTALMQLFPEWLWDSTQLGIGRKLFARAIVPGIANSQLTLSNLPVWLPINWQESLVLPVLNLEPEVLKQWSRVVAGLGQARISTYLFDLEFIKERVSANNNSELQAVTDSSSEVSQKEQAEILVKKFLASASITAQKLAGMMAAAPVSMSVVNLIRKTLLKEATPVHVAEVYMSGLLQTVVETNESPTRVYDFLPNVREVLNQAIGEDATVDVLDTISRYIAEEIDRPIRSFTALLVLMPQFKEIEQEKIMPFAQIAVEVLQNLGGEYAEFADRVAKSIPPINKIDNETADNLLPELEICTFDVATFIESETELELTFVIATIEIQETHIFEFEVATLLRRDESLGFGKWVIERQQEQRTAIIEVLEADVDLELIEIPGGSFIMGAPEDELDSFDRERPHHKVTVSSFYMGRYPITQAQWKEVASWEQVERKLESDPSRFKEDYESMDRWTRPVERVSWEDAKEFCDRLSQKTGKEYRLPTEAEWEYACRGGTTTPFHFGETISTELANYRGNYTYGEGVKGEYRKQTTPVGYFGVANNFGLSDLHGNVWEWCEDNWHDNYEDAPTDGSAWLSGNSNRKVIRGGSWYCDPGLCRSAFRFYFTRGNRDVDIGFRVVCVAGRTT